MTEQAFEIIENLTEELGEKEDIIMKQEQLIKKLYEQMNEKNVMITLYKVVLPHLQMEVNDFAENSFTDPEYFKELEEEDFEKIFSIIYDCYEDFRYEIYKEFLHLKKIEDKCSLALWEGIGTGYQIVSEEYLRTQYQEEGEEEDNCSSEDCLYEVIDYLQNTLNYIIVDLENANCSGAEGYFIHDSC